MTIEWPSGLYGLLESSILEGVKFKTDFVSGAQAIFEIICTYSDKLDINEYSELNRLLQESLFRSYICIQGKSYI